MQVLSSHLFSEVALCEPARDSVDAFDSTSVQAFTKICGSPPTAKYMPPDVSIDGLSICGAATANTLFLQSICLRKKMVCSGIDPATIPSILSFAAIGGEALDAADENSPVELKPNNPLYIDRAMDPYYILKKAGRAKKVYAASCYAFDRFVARFDKGSPREKAIASGATFIKLQTSYTKLREMESRGVCTECLNAIVNELKADFDIFDSISDIQEALKKDETFQQFLHRLLLGSCKTTIPFSPKIYVQWPENKSATGAPSYDEAVEQIKKVLDTGTALGMNLCTDKIPQGNLSDCAGHALVVSGFRKSCKTVAACTLSADDPQLKELCRDMIQIHNPWGADWQSMNNDGWVDARTLIQHADIGRSTQLMYFKPPESN